MMLGVGLGYMAWPPLPPPGDGPFGGDGSGDSPSSFTERRFSAGRAGGAATATRRLVRKRSSCSHYHCSSGVLCSLARREAHNRHIHRCERPWTAPILGLMRK